MKVPMNRLESIKERNESLHPSKRIEYDNPLELALTWTRNYWSDTYYLLQRLERYEKALLRSKEVLDTNMYYGAVEEIEEALKE